MSEKKYFRFAIYVSATFGVLALVTSVIGVIENPRHFFQSYLFSFLFWSDLPLGALPFVMIYPLTGGRWGAACQEIFVALSDTILVIALLFIPIFIGLKWIYPWMSVEVASDPRVFHKHLYLNSTSFIVRTVFYLTCWLILNVFLKRYEGAPEKLKGLCAGGLVLYGFTASFAAIDWQMSLEPTWYSTVYGMVFVMGQSLSAFAFALIVFGIAAKKKGCTQLFPKTTLRDLGNMFLMIVMLWAYLSFMQYLIVWSGNLPHEVIWFKHRTQGGWQWLALILALFQFSAPFVLLLFRATKDKIYRLATVGAIVFMVRVVDHYWMLMPALEPQHFVLPWQAITTWLGLGGIWFAYFLNRLVRKPLFAEQGAYV